MSKKTNFPFFIKTISLISLLILSGCATMDDEPQERQYANPDAKIGQPPMSGSQNTTPNVANQNQHRPEEGMIRINRHGPGYDISMDINASDENIAFLMDLPQQKQIDKLKKDIYASTKLVMEAQALFYKKEYNKSSDKLDSAIELALDNAYAHALHGSVLFKLGKTQDAIIAWQRALELDPSLTDINNTLKKLGVNK